MTINPQQQKPKQLLINQIQLSAKTSPDQPTPVFSFNHITKPPYYPQMKKYNPIDYNRTLWYDKSRTKNHPRNCKHTHTFCTLDYEWSEPSQNLQLISRPINSTIPNVTLPPNSEGHGVKYENMTEETIDDWIAQSMNRTINSMLNPNKKFFIPSSLDEQLKNRYKNQRKNLKIQPDDTYFKTRNITTKQKSYLNHKKSKTIDMSDLIVDYSRMQPKKTLGRTLISARQQRNQPPKQLIKRRNAILLDKDIHYERFMKQKRTSDPDSGFNLNAEKRVIEYLNKNKLFTLNYESLRRKRLNEKAPCSITEYDGIKIEMSTPNYSLEKNSKLEQWKQEEQQELYRLKGNAHAEQAYSIMENFSTTRTRKSFRTKISFSEDKPESDRLKMFSLISLHDPIVRTLSNRTEKKQKITFIGKKVIKLLEEMHIESEIINLEMANFALHPEMSELTKLNPNNLSHKWINKAQQQLKLGHLQTSFECYKQAIISEPELFNPVYNFACLLQRENRYSSSLKWFKLTREFESDTERVTFAVSLVNLKMEKFEESFEEINKLINELIFEKKKVDVRYYYVRALCNKKFGKYDAARKDYKLVLQQSRAKNADDLAMFAISYLFAKKRRLVPHMGCLAYTNFHETIFLNLYEKGPNLTNEGDMYTNLVERIKNFSFFKRFPPQLVQRLVKTSNYEYHQPNQIIFIKPDECIIVLDGLMIIKNHQKDVFLHQIISLLKQGDFIGGNSIDNHKNSNLNNWYFTRTHVELLRMKSDEFQSFWKGQLTIDLDQKFNILKNNPLFDGLCEAILFKLCELMNVKKYKKGEVVFNDGSYRAKAASKSGCGFSLLHNSLTQPIETSNKKHSNTAHTFTQMKFDGLYIVKRGRIKIQDEKGFSNSQIIGQNDFFGQNLIIDVNGFHNCGRLLVASEEAQFYVLEIKDLIWCFSSDDKVRMVENCRNMERRKSLQLVIDLRKRYEEYLEVRQKFKMIQD